MAEAILRAELEKRGAVNIEVSSAGTGAWDDRPASDGAMLVSLEHQLDISSHRSRHLNREMVEKANIIFTMSRLHTERVRKLGGDGKVFLFGEYAGKKRTRAEVADPYGLELKDYRHTFDQLAAYARTVADRLVAENHDERSGDQ